jgi:hypothetical protein
MTRSATNTDAPGHAWLRKKSTDMRWPDQHPITLSTLHPGVDFGLDGLSQAIMALTAYYDDVARVTAIVSTTCISRLNYTPLVNPAPIGGYDSAHSAQQRYPHSFGPLDFRGVQGVSSLWI